MADIYEDLMAAARSIAACFPAPRFYAECAAALDLSRSLFEGHPRVLQCRQWASRFLQENLGHGIEHAGKVAIEAGALVQIEGERQALPAPIHREITILVQIAGLLHDLCRSEIRHAQASAQAAGRFFEESGLFSPYQAYIPIAIANHEAFVPPVPIDSAIGQMISDALYDADKFRWGPDNFTLTLWEMLRARRAPIGPLIRRFRKGMEGIARIKGTFRSEAGKTFGPEFIDLGLQIGQKIYAFLLERFPQER
jgi:hypothetical protein